MAKVFQIKSIRPKGLLSEKRMRTYILNAIDEQGREGVQYFYYTVDYWKSRANFDYSVKYAGGNLLLRIYPIDDGSGEFNAAGNFVPNYKKWLWLNYGTDVRYAHMGRGWRSKTKVPGSIGTNTAGFYTGVRLGFPIIPGIEARRWDKVIRRLMRKGYTKAIDDAIRKGLSGK